MRKLFEWREYIPWLKRLNLWLLLAPVYSSIFVVAAHRLGQDWIIAKAPQEYLGIGLIMVPTAVMYYRWKSGHGPLFAILAFLAAALLFREIHIRYTGEVVYVCLAIVAVWTARWWGRIVPQLEQGRTFAFVFSTLFAYLASQLIARRVFKGIVGEQELHIQLEEAAENAAHLLFIATSFYGFRKTHAMANQKPDTQND